MEKEVDWMIKATLQGRQATLYGRTCPKAVVWTLYGVPGLQRRQVAVSAVIEAHAHGPSSCTARA